ncbi:permease prefix domain 1-containing protein [Sediminibacillus albus]|uniref:permease prefix domain 1-containing protein n=1 Tax=Sediminibacillus albus TaxID=407036 RepID=UPI000B862179|nr:permease prefix domain 1-containing protein [Sediminibacillus albus]
MCSTINGYLNKLSDNLNVLPEEERKNILKEIEIHLEEKVNALKKDGYSYDAAVNKMLSEFQSPYSLSPQDYLDEYDETKIQQKPTISFFLLNIGILGLGVLSLPILEKELELAWVTLGVPQVICGLGALLLLNKRDTFILVFLKIAPKILLSLYFPMSLLFLWISFNDNYGVVNFSMYYMFIYWLTLLIYYLVIKRTSQKHQIN